MNAYIRKGAAWLCLQLARKIKGKRSYMQLTRLPSTSKWHHSFLLWGWKLKGGYNAHS